MPLYEIPKESDSWWQILAERIGLSTDKPDPSILVNPVGILGGMFRKPSKSFKNILSSIGLEVNFKKAIGGSKYLTIYDEHPENIILDVRIADHAKTRTNFDPMGDYSSSFDLNLQRSASAEAIYGEILSGLKEKLLDEARFYRKYMPENDAARRYENMARELVLPEKTWRKEDVHW